MNNKTITYSILKTNEECDCYQCNHHMIEGDHCIMEGNPRYGTPFCSSRCLETTQNNEIKTLKSGSKQNGTI